MAIRTTQVPNTSHRNIIFPEHALAHRLLDGLTGLELGAAAHNPFGLGGSRNVGPDDDHAVYRASEIDMCGAYAEIDLAAEGDNLPVEADSQDYIITSHVFEHFPNPLAALKEWDNVLKDGGIVFMIVPKRDALQSDAVRPLSTFDQWFEAYDAAVTVDTWENVFPNDHVDRRGHYFVYTPDTLVALIAEACTLHGLEWELIAREDTDSKVGNGFTLAYRVSKPAPVVEDEPEVVEVVVSGTPAPEPAPIISGEPEDFVPLVVTPKPATKPKTPTKPKAK